MSNPRRWKIVLFLLVLLVSSGPTATAQSTRRIEPEPRATASQRQAAGGAAAQRQQRQAPDRARRQPLRPLDPERRRLRILQEIGLSPDQIARLKEIRRAFEREGIELGRRIRQARLALDRAIMSEEFDEALINEKAEGLALAHADLIRFVSRIRTEVRSVLTVEQVKRFNELERRLMRLDRGEQLPEEDQDR